MSDDRKVTEDLLSGFDRTGRTPRAPPVRAVDERRGLETVALRPARPAVWPWVAIGAVFTITLGTVGILFMPDNKPAPAPIPVVAPRPSASAAPPVVVVEIAPVVSASIPAPSAAPPPRPAAPATSAPKPTGDQRGDFVRNL